MTDDDTGVTGGAAPFREESAQLTRELLAHELVPAEREDTVRELLHQEEPTEALRVALFEEHG